MCQNTCRLFAQTALKIATLMNKINGQQKKALMAFVAKHKSKLINCGDLEQKIIDLINAPNNLSYFAKLDIDSSDALFFVKLYFC